MTGTPLVAYVDTAICDRCAREGDLITDGHVAYAATGVTPDQPFSGTEATLILRLGTKVEVTCTAPRDWDRDADELCGGRLDFDLTRESWRSITPDRQSLLDAGKPMERAW